MNRLTDRHSFRDRGWVEMTPYGDFRLPYNAMFGRRPTKLRSQRDINQDWVTQVTIGLFMGFVRVHLANARDVV